jgi:hypothetical protein
VSFDDAGGFSANLGPETVYCFVFEDGAKCRPNQPLGPMPRPFHDEVETRHLAKYVPWD